MLAILSMISCTTNGQGSDYRHGMGLIAHRSMSGMINSKQYENPGYGPFQIFSSVYKPADDPRDFETEPQTVYNRMTPADEISGEQVRLIFDKVKEFPENSEISIAFISKERVAFYGLKRQNNRIINIDNRSSVFEIGSITKVFTATLLANYVNNGMLSLDDHINSYLPFNLHDNIRISFMDLANHTSGLPRIPSNMPVLSFLSNRNPYRDYSENRLERYLTAKARVDGPSGSFAYSNIGLGLLGYTLCKIENRTYNDLLQEKIFSKYGMTNSSAVRSELEDDLVSGLNKNGFKTPNWEFAALESAGAILSTAEDLSKFAVAQFDEADKDLALTREQTFTRDENEGMGLGWFITRTSTGDILYRHKGVTGGYTSAMAIDTENETGIIILSNVSGFSRKMGNIDTLCFELLAALSNDKQ